MTSSLNVVCGLAVLKNMLSSHKKIHIMLVLPSAGGRVILHPAETNCQDRGLIPGEIYSLVFTSVAVARLEVHDLKSALLLIFQYVIC